MSQRGKFVSLLVVLCFAGLAVWLWVLDQRKSARVDVNTATFEQLDGVPYVTPEVARGIIAGRPFGSVDELVRVSGIGEVTLGRVRKFLKVK